MCIRDRHWESGRVLETWSYRWASEIFHEFAKQVTGLEAAQVRKEEAVQRHFRLSCVAQSLVQQAPASGSTSERFAFAKGESTYGQRCHTIVREAWSGLLRLVASLLALSLIHISEPTRLLSISYAVFCLKKKT